MNNREVPQKKLKNERETVTKGVKKKEPSTVRSVVFMIFKVNLKIISYLINIILTLFLIGIITGGIVVGAFAVYIKTYIDPTLDDLAVVASSLDMTTSIWYQEYDDRIEKTNPRWVEWESERLYSVENRFWEKYKNMPETLINAFVAIEDHRFFEHQGVDIFRSGSAIRNFFFPSADGKTFGGSTLTQQLIKLTTGDDEQRMQRKIQEILRAIYLEKKTSKEEILENYLNIVPLSNNCFGVKAAAEQFFNKTVPELSLIECASLAAIVNAPYYYDPIRFPDNNKYRRDIVLKEMRDYGYITEEEFSEAYDKELIITRPDNSYTENIKSYYTDQVMNDVISDLMKLGYTKEMAYGLMYSGGLQIYICMDKFVQETMEYVYQRDEYFPAIPEGQLKHESAMVVLDPKTGDLLGIVGGQGEKNTQRGLNRASGSFRQPGSAIKPISVYTPALDRGIINWGTPMNDNAVMKTSAGKWWPSNLPASYEGKITLARAIAVSKNTTAVRVLQELTPEYSFKFMHDDLNITSLVDNEVLPSGKVMSDVDLAPLALGGLTYGVSVYQLTSAYTMLANDGIYSKPRSYTKVTDINGNVILDNKSQQKPLISEETAAIMTKLLMGVVETGTASTLPYLKDKIEVAAKTGTTNENKDRWFIGYTPYYLCGVWFGYDEPKYLQITGNPPMNLFAYVMEALHRQVIDNPKSFSVPPTVISAQYCFDSGMAAGSGCKVMTGYFAKGAEPREKCTTHTYSYTPPSYVPENKPPEPTAPPATVAPTEPIESTEVTEPTEVSTDIPDTTEAEVAPTASPPAEPQTSPPAEVTAPPATDPPQATQPIEVATSPPPATEAPTVSQEITPSPSPEPAQYEQPATPNNENAGELPTVGSE